MSKKAKQFAGEISWRRVRAIFHDPPMPKQVWEKQFDYCDEDLERVAHTPYEKILLEDLWYYFHDLCYVELQPDLFQYLFPVCLMHWHTTLQQNESCAQGDAEFHRGLQEGNILEKMLTPVQRDEVLAFFRDSFLARLDAERGFIYDAANTPAYGWMARLGSLAMTMPSIEQIWTPWWQASTPGRAVCVLQYCSGLIYPAGENPLFDPWTRESGGGGPYLWGSDSYILGQGWLEANIDFVTPLLTYDNVLRCMTSAVATLADEPEHATAREVLAGAVKHKELVELRLTDLPRLLREPDQLDGWNV